MPSEQPSQLKDVSRFTLVLENALRKLIRFLIGRISLTKLQEMIGSIFVEEAEKSVIVTEPGKGASLTKLALLTGLDTRTLTKIKNSDSYRRPFHGESNFLYDLIPGMALLDYWGTQLPFMDGKKRKPKVLKISGTEESFETLFFQTVKSRGVTATSLLDRLAASGAVEVNAKKNTVRMLRQSYLPSEIGDQLSSIEIGFAVIGNLMDTVFHNINALETGEDLWFQRSAWTRRLAFANQSEFRLGMRKILNDTEEVARDLLSKYEESIPEPGQLTAGFSLFYFEQES